METHHIDLHGEKKEFGFHSGTDAARDFLRKNSHAAADYHKHAVEHGEAHFYAEGAKYKIVIKEENGEEKASVERSHH